MGRNRGDRAVNVMVGEVRRFQIGRLADLILVCPAVFLTGRMAVLLEQTLAGKGNGLVAQNGGGKYSYGKWEMSIAILKR